MKVITVKTTAGGIIELEKETYIGYVHSFSPIESVWDYENNEFIRMDTFEPSLEIWDKYSFTKMEGLTLKVILEDGNYKCEEMAFTCYDDFEEYVSDRDLFCKQAFCSKRNLFVYTGGFNCLMGIWEKYSY